MNALHAERLLKLATHLETGKRHHDKFDFTVLHVPSVGPCGTAGCAIGECPAVFPDDWAFDDSARTVWGMGEYPVGWSKMAEDFFGLSWRQVQHLFVAEGQRPDLYGGRHLTDGATAVDVAANIREFVELVELETL